jgi:hypothetical protein
MRYLSLLLLLVVGCKDEGRAPFYMPPPEDRDRDAASEELGRDSGEDEPRPAIRCTDGSPELRVLFIGNSHTFTNDLPALARELACDAGTKLITDQSTPGGVDLNQHAASPDTLAKIDAQPWDFVVMHDQQQRPGYRLDEVEEVYLPGAVALVEAIRGHRAETRPVFLMVWARRDGDTQNCDYYPLACSFETSTRAVEQGYRLYVERTDAELAPAALAWAAVRADTDSPLEPAALWADDGSHPALPGSYLAAATLVGMLLEVESEPLTFSAGLEPSTASYLRGVADRIVREDKAQLRTTTAERVSLLCPYSAACNEMADAKPVTFALSLDSCDDMLAGRAEIAGTLSTTAGCLGQCSTVPLGAWLDVSGGELEDAAYQALVHVDMNANGKIDEGDLEACEAGGFEVGGGADLTFTALRVL